MFAMIEKSIISGIREVLYELLKSEKDAEKGLKEFLKVMGV